tara:strand:- start:15 stop:494 length:480 start_codon:yes stop_codon:yes gene_type:complete
MYIFLNPPKSFWGIPDTDIQLSRSSPFYDISKEEQEKFTEDQKAILAAAKKLNVITEINPEFVPANLKKVGVDFIVTRPVSEIQRRYVSRMVMTKDTKALTALLEAEQKRDRPRPAVMQMVKYGLETIAYELGGDYYNQIDEGDDSDGISFDDIVIEDS